MASFKFCAVLLVTYLLGVYAQDAQEETTNVVPAQKKKISEQILTILEHYKQDDPVGLPGAPIPDPMDVPNMSHSFTIGRLNLINAKMYGLKKFRINHVNVDVAALKVEAALTIDELRVLGNYTLSTFFSRAAGPFSVNLTNVYVQAIAKLEVERTGLLEAQEIDMDLKFKTISMDFKNLGYFASIFQGMMNSVGTFVFDSIKPFVLQEVNKNIRTDVNNQVRQLPQKFPNSISPFDQAVSEVRREIRRRNYDPFKVTDYNNSVGVFDVSMTHTWLYGLSSVHRVGDIRFELKNKTLEATFEVGTQRLRGTSHWEVGLMAGILSKAGTVDFTVEYFRVKIVLSQSTDTSIPPKLEDIQLELGNIQVRFNGAGTIDYVIEFGVNVIPNLLRYQIMDALEGPLKTRVQEALNTVNVENIIREHVDMIDNPKMIELM